MLEEIMHDSKDNKLCEEIQYRISDERNKYGILTNKTDDSSIYITEMERSHEQSIFSSYNNAFDYISSYAIKSESGFTIKLYLLNENDNSIAKTDDGNDHESAWDFVDDFNFKNMPLITASYNKDGDLLWLVKEPEEFLSFCNDDFEDSFENSYIDIPNPFIAGTIVKDVNENAKYGIVPDEAHQKLFRDNNKADFSDIYINVFQLTRDGFWILEAFNPLEIEAVNEGSYNDVSVEYEEVLKAYRRYLCDESEKNKHLAIKSLNDYRNSFMHDSRIEQEGDDLFPVKTFMSDLSEMPVYIRNVCDVF